MAIETALRAGNKMHAIRLYMEAVPGSTMGEAKEQVESILTGLYVESIGAKGHILQETSNGSPFTSNKSIMVGIAPVDRLQIAEALFEGRISEGIKILRRIAPELDHSKAKKIIELYEEELYAAYPGRFKPGVHKKKKIHPAIILVVAVIVIVLLIVGIYVLILW